MKIISNGYGILWLVLALYTASLLFVVWRLALGKIHRRWPKMALMLPGFALHTLYLWERGLSQGRCPVSNLFETLTFTAWCLVAIHLIITALARINYLTIFYIPLVLMVQLAALVGPTDQTHFKQWKEASWLGFHASLIILGYAAFGLAGAVALMYLIQDRQLRTRRLSSSFMLFPPVLRLELVQIWSIITGFCLLTIGLLIGIAGLTWAQWNGIGMDAKLLWSFSVWGMYLMILIGRFVWGTAGRLMAWLSVLGCLFVLSTFWLVNAWSHFHHY